MQLSKEQSDALRIELSVKAKNGVNFILAAGILWSGIGLIWMLDEPAVRKSVMTFYSGIFMLPLAWVFSRVFKTAWVVKGNPLDPLGLWLNLAQLGYFPLLFFFLSHTPEYFVMAYAIITGAHFFPYGWFYKTHLYSVGAGVISAGAWLIAVRWPGHMAYVPFFTSICLVIHAGLLTLDYRRKRKTWEPVYAGTGSESNA
jgi:hypothetical protein